VQKNILLQISKSAATENFLPTSQFDDTRFWNRMIPHKYLLNMLLLPQESCHPTHGFLSLLLFRPGQAQENSTGNGKCIPSAHLAGVDTYDDEE